jgi:uncharacterized RDD family membrane protein YckC
MTDKRDVKLRISPRLAAFLIDGLLIASLSSIACLLIARTGIQPDDFIRGNEVLALVPLALAICYFAIGAPYATSLGKRCLQMTVVDDNDDRAGLGQMLARLLVFGQFPIVVFGGLALTRWIANRIEDPDIPDAIIGIALPWVLLSVLSLLIVIVDLISLFSAPNGRALHDRLAGTHVIRT